VQPLHSARVARPRLPALPRAGRHDEQILKLDERYRRERQELISRIQRPTFTPVPAQTGQPERAEPDELQKIGQVMPYGKPGENISASPSVRGNESISPLLRGMNG
jgi:hypothetical protein